MRLTISALILMGGCIFWFLSVSAPPRKEVPYVPFGGVITGKQWIPEGMDTITVYHPNGLQSPVFIFTEERWILFSGRSSKRVTKEEFKTIEIGQYWKEKAEK